MNEGAFADRDAFGLTVADWRSFLGDGPRVYSGPALLWWALVGRTCDEGPGSMSYGPMPELLAAIVGDAHALAMLTGASQEDDVRALAPALENLYRRIATAAEIATRVAEEEARDHGSRADPLALAPPAPPAPKPPPRRR